MTINYFNKIVLSAQCYHGVPHPILKIEQQLNGLLISFSKGTRYA